ncbi:metalloregulator ArsR/SmtB family transcription factor [Myxococcota bacterium]|nr:metalloregulator ArsR/SmtB family transcription factor [Myxococcota bacterium]
MEKRCCPEAAVMDYPKSEGEANTRLAELAKALGHSARVAILRLLMRRTSCICGEIVEELPLAQSTVSQHLKVLKEAGWIRGEIEGPKVCYCIEPEVMGIFQRLLEALSSETSE